MRPGVADRRADAVESDEAALWAARDGPDAERARHALFELYAPLARRIAARRFEARSADVDIRDVRQLAYAGLLEAIPRYDPARGAPFAAYASRRIAGSVLDGLAKMSERREQTAFAARTRNERIRSLLSVPADSIALPTVLETLAELAAELAVGFMLEGGLAPDGEPLAAGPDAYRSLAWKQTLGRLSHAVATLPPRDGAIVRQHYLHGVSFEQIAVGLRLTKGRVSQLHKSAIARLRVALADDDESLSA